jgi:hypothetical protein
MYPEFHPPTFIQPSTHRPGYQHPKPEVVETHPAFHRVGPRGAWWVTLLQGTRSGDPAFRRVRTRGPAAWFSSSSSALFVVFVVVQPPPGDPVLGAKQSSSPPGPSTILPALTIFVCISTCSPYYSHSTCIHLIAATGRYDRLRSQFQGDLPSSRQPRL